MKKGALTVIIILVSIAIPLSVMSAPGGNKPPKTVDADTLDGLDSSDFSLSNHSHSPKIGYLSIPATAFKPSDHFSPTPNYVSYHSYLGLFEDTTAYFDAPVFLPHNATITNITLYWFDQDSIKDMHLSLLSWQYLAGQGYEHVRLFSNGNPGSGNTSSSSIATPIVDNINRAYSLEVFMYGDTNSSRMTLHGVVIEYEYVD